MSSLFSSFLIVNLLAIKIICELLKGEKFKNSAKIENMPKALVFIIKVHPIL